MRSTIAILLLAACASTPRPAPKGGPRGLHANEHLDIANSYDQQAREASRWPDDPSQGGVRWVRSWNAAEEQERLAATHRSKAAELNAAFQDACGDRSVDEISVSPLQRWSKGGTNTAKGVIVYLDARAGDADRLLADLKCHRAWMMLAPAGMEACPLDLPGLIVDASGDLDGITLWMTVRDPALVPELQRRTAHDIEAGANLQRGAMR